uniref:Uncharacterized protein n=1 Tax=Anguilla anguilla TaxID=7936 RepID=A0A0E9RJ77_ANGAN
MSADLQLNDLLNKPHKWPTFIAGSLLVANDRAFLLVLQVANEQT